MGLERRAFDMLYRQIRPGALTFTNGIGSGQVIAMSSVVSQVDSAYAACGCSPLGKLTQSSRPRVTGGDGILDDQHLRWNRADEGGAGS